MTTRDSFPRQISTAETLTRGDAMRAAIEWAGQLRFELASRAAWRQADTDETRSFAAAQDAMSMFTELPEDNEFPDEAEERWRLRVQLHASATGGISYEQANANLREDFKRYLKLLDDVLSAWQQQDFSGSCKMPVDEVMEFSYFWCNECGMSPQEPFELLEGIHTPLCLCKEG